MNENVSLPSERDASGRSFGDTERRYLSEVIDSGVLFGPNGTKVKAFERGFAELLDVSFARAVSSGSAAVHTALAALDLAPGDEVVTTPITDMGAISPILFHGALPVFADVDPETLNVTPETIAAVTTPQTRVIIVTHLFGNPCAMEPILQFAREREIYVLEDSAQAYLATYRGRYVGTLGDMGAFSLQQTKQMACGEGGVVVTDSTQHARRARVWADKGWNYDPDDPDHEFLGLNYRMSELQGAVALAQVEKLSAMVARRVEVAALLNECISSIAGVRPVPVADDSVCTYWRFPLLVDHDIVPGGPEALSAALKPLGVWSTPNYIRVPAFMCRQFQQRVTFRDSGFPYTLWPDRPPETPEAFPGCRSGLDDVLVLPWTEKHTEAHVAMIARSIEDAVETLASGRIHARSTS